MSGFRETNLYNFFSILGYFVGVLNIYLFFSLLLNLNFSWLFFILVFFLVILVSFVFSSITYMYIDMQKKEVTVRGKMIFNFYGESFYITLFLLPFAYLKVIDLTSMLSAIVFFVFTLLSVWLYRVFMIKKITGLNFFNSFIAVFFPHIFFSFSFFSLVFFLVFITYAFIN
ncbi:MAG: hypothetical protein N2446_01105 [Elusimicrobiales bacterium]|nr:hypothetical protein [Elusimicrobiales bacterium]